MYPYSKYFWLHFYLKVSDSFWTCMSCFAQCTNWRNCRICPQCSNFRTGVSRSELLCRARGQILQIVQIVILISFSPQWKFVTNHTIYLSIKCCRYVHCTLWKQLHIECNQAKLNNIHSVKKHALVQNHLQIISIAMLHSKSQWK